MELKGIYVTPWQHPGDEPIDWPAVKAAGVDLAWLKATQGTEWVSPHLAEDAIEAAAAGLVVGAVHYGVPGDGEAADQAAFHRAACHGLDLGLGHALDLHTFGTAEPYALGGWAEAWLKAMGEGGGRLTLCTDPAWLSTYMAGAPYGADLWTREGELPPGKVRTYAERPGGGEVDGVLGRVDWVDCLDARGINPPTIARPPVEPAPGMRALAAAERWAADPGPMYVQVDGPSGPGSDAGTTFSTGTASGSYDVEAPGAGEP